MASGFKFPPPPPPPPLSNLTNSDVSTRSGSRGGSWQIRGRGRGVGPRMQRSGRNRSKFDWDRPQKLQDGLQQPSSRQISCQTTHTTMQKRAYTQAFPITHGPQPHGNTSPAVPSYGSHLPVPSIMTQSGPDVPLTKKKRARAYNQLGLTPRQLEHESSEEEDDANDEIRLGSAALRSGYSGMQFEHNGSILSLNSPEDIAAWVAERRRRYPTKAKRAEAAAAKTRATKQFTVARSDQRLREGHKPRRRNSKEKTEQKSSDNRKIGFKSAMETGEALVSLQTINHNILQPVNVDSCHSGTFYDVDGEGVFSDASLDSTTGDDSTSSSGQSDGSDISDEPPLERSSKVEAEALTSSELLSDGTKETQEVYRGGQHSRNRQKKDSCRQRYIKDRNELHFASTKSLASQRQLSRPSLYEKMMAQQNREDDIELLRYILAMGDQGMLKNAPVTGTNIPMT